MLQTGKVARDRWSINNAGMFNNLEHGQTEYLGLATAQAGGATHCVGCGKCESHCPQSLPVM